MIRAILKQVFFALLTLWAIATGTFFLMEFAPGGPASAERRLDPVVEAANLASLGLADLVRSACAGRIRSLPPEGQSVAATEQAGRVEGDPGCAIQPGHDGEVFSLLVQPGDQVAAGQALFTVRPSAWVRYLRMLASIATLDLGVTYTSRGDRTVREVLAQGLPVSATLGLLALGIALLIGWPAGLVAAARPGSFADRALSVLATAQVSIPSLVLAPLLLYVFSIRFPVFSAGGLEGPSDLVLPAATLGLILAGLIQRMTRAGAASFLASPTAMVLRARGLSEVRLLGVHALRHAAIPMLGYLPPVVAGLLTGSLVVERVFNLPGISRHLVAAALNRDHPVVLGVVLAYSVLLVGLNMLASVLHPVLDPRVRDRDLRDRGPDVRPMLEGPTA